MIFKRGECMYCYPRIKDLREDRDLKQVDLANILKTTQQQYSKYETGFQEIPVHHLISLAKYYGVTLDYLVEMFYKAENRE